MIKAMILEDMPDNRELLKKMLHDYCPDVQLAGEAETVEQAYELIQSSRPDLLFLDIQLDRETSFDLLKRLKPEDDIHFEIIFITGVGTYENVTRAIEFSALDMIHKPISCEKLIKAVEKASRKLNRLQYHRQIELMLDILNHKSSKSRRIAFHLPKGIIEFVEVDHIVSLQADGVVTHINLHNNIKLTAMKNLGYYAKLLTADYDFFQIGNDTVVNLEYVKRYNHSELTLTLTDGSHLIAARRGGQDFRRFLTENRKYSSVEEHKGVVQLLKRLLN